MAEAAIKEDTRMANEPDAANEQAGARVSELPQSSPRRQKHWLRGLIRFVLMLVLLVQQLLVTILWYVYQFADHQFQV